jgi:transcriptional regulator with XRE-family HTH domain
VEETTSLGQKLREWRQRRFLTQNELAGRIGVSWQSVARWEAGKSVPYPSNQRGLILALRIDPEEFFEALRASQDPEK